VDKNQPADNKNASEGRSHELPPKASRPHGRILAAWLAARLVLRSVRLREKQRREGLVERRHFVPYFTILKPWLD
jgi:hypothetical protein